MIPLCVHRRSDSQNVKSPSACIIRFLPSKMSTTIMVNIKIPCY